MHKENLKILSQQTLKKYNGADNASEILSKINKDLNDIFNKYLDQNHVFADDFPIEFENELGKWQIHADGTTYVQPKTGVQHIDVSFQLNKHDQ